MFIIRGGKAHGALILNVGGCCIMGKGPMTVSYTLGEVCPPITIDKGIMIVTMSYTLGEVCPSSENI